MLNRSRSLLPAVAASSRLQKPRFSKYILVGAIAPATLLSVQSIFAVDRFLPPDYTITGGNDIVLRAIPEPQTWVTLIGSIGALVGLQRFRRRG